MFLVILFGLMGFWGLLQVLSRKPLKVDEGKTALFAKSLDENAETCKLPLHHVAVHLSSIAAAKKLNGIGD